MLMSSVYILQSLQLFFLSIVGLATAMGQSLKIPLLMWSLTQKYDYILNGAKVFVLDRAMWEYLESGVVVVSGGNVTNFLYDWWNQSDLPIDSTSLFSIFTLAKCLTFHDKEVNQQPLIAGPGPIPPVPLEHLNKLNYGWHDSTWRDPNGNHCPRCRLYHATAVGLMNELKDIENLVNAVEMLIRPKVLCPLVVHLF